MDGSPKDCGAVDCSLEDWYLANDSQPSRREYLNKWMVRKIRDWGMVRFNIGC